MYDLTIIKRNGGAYIDSREVAEAIGKNHKDLLRDIRGYINIMEKRGQRNFAPSSFFIESSFINTQNKEMPCYLLSKLGCELCANKLIGERGILFTAAYVEKFNTMEAAERDAEIKAHARPRLSEYNSATRNVLNGLSQCRAKPDSVMKFMRGVYEPLGIKVLPLGYDDYLSYYTVTEIAEQLGIYSETRRPHGHAVSAIISKLKNIESHTVAIPYGLIGVSMRYDSHIIKAVKNWITENNFPNEVPYQGFDYHIYYGNQESQLSLCNLGIEIYIKLKN